MRPRALQLLRTLGKLTAVGAGVAASITATVIVAKAASSSCSDDFSANQCVSQLQYSHIPETDRPPFRKWNFNWDKMEPGQGENIWPKTTDETKCSNKNPASSCEDYCKNLPAKYPKARRNLVLIRHGQYNIVGKDDSCQILTELGREQAAITGKKLGSMGIKFKSITSSAMIRAIQTANIILENIDPENQKNLKLEVNDPLLNEGTPCIPEPPYQNKDSWNPPIRDVLVDSSRIEAAFRKYFHRAEVTQEEDSWEIIVCHGNVIRYFFCRALQFPPEGWLRISIDHCSITRFTILPTGEVILRSLGDSGHIPNAKATVL